MNAAPSRKPAGQGKTLLITMVGIGAGLFCAFSHEWEDDGQYVVRNKVFGTEHVREGRDMNRNRQIVGYVLLATGAYGAFCLLRRKSPFWNELDYAPEATHRVVPQMPANLRQQMISGHATIEFVVDAEGRVTEPAVYHATHPEFGAAALAAVAQWTFLPAIKRGQPTPCRLRVPIDFKGDRPFIAG